MADPVDTHEPISNGHAASLDQLRNRRSLLSRMIMWDRFFIAFMACGVLMCLTFGIISVGLFSPTFRLVGLPLFGLIYVGAIYVIRNHSHQTSIDRDEVDFQIDLQQFVATPRQSRAEKLLRLHDLQLRRYYEIN